MSENNAALSPAANARKDWRQGLGHDENPYAKGSVQREQYMMEMARLQDKESQDLQAQLRIGK